MVWKGTGTSLLAFKGNDASPLSLSFGGHFLASKTVTPNISAKHVIKNNKRNDASDNALHKVQSPITKHAITVLLLDSSDPYHKARAPSLLQHYG